MNKIKSFVAGRTRAEFRIVRKVIGAAAALVGLLGLTQPAQAVLLQSGETMRVTFSIPGNPTTPLGEVDVLAFNLTVSCSGLCAAPSHSTSIFDGTTLLGTHDSTFARPGTFFAFTSQSSRFTNSSTRLANFSPIANGTIEGILEVTNTSTTPYTFIDLNTTYDFSIGGPILGQGGSPNSIDGANLTPVILSQTIK
ncbi:MAG: hypothetical protein MI806_23630, partial [Minwuiales bacterium]|nr:hypothetical protein [Minwuiales bacterium]